jgi:hypothetical protein
MHKCDVDGCPRNTHLVQLNDRGLCFRHHSEATGRGPDTVAPRADQRATDELKKTDGLD